jgi:hypothetical protein
MKNPKSKILMATKMNNSFKLQLKYFKKSWKLQIVQTDKQKHIKWEKPGFQITPSTYNGSSWFL